MHRFESYRWRQFFLESGRFSCGRPTTWEPRLGTKNAKNSAVLIPEDHKFQILYLNKKYHAIVLASIMQQVLSEPRDIWRSMRDFQVTGLPRAKDARMSEPPGIF